MTIPSWSSLYAAMMRAPIELGRLVHLAQRRAAPVLAPEVEDERADLLASSEKSKAGTFCGMAADYAMSGNLDVGNLDVRVEDDLVAVVS